MSQDGFPNISPTDVVKNACSDSANTSTHNNDTVETLIVDGKQPSTMNVEAGVNSSDGVFFNKFSVPLTLSTVVSSGSECSSSENAVPLTMALINKMINSKADPDDSDLSGHLTAADLHVDDWLKSRSNSMSSLDFDPDLRTSEIDMNDFLSIKSCQSQPQEQQLELKSAMTQVDMDNVPETPSINQLLNCTLAEPNVSIIPASSSISNIDEPIGRSCSFLKKENCHLLDRGLFEEMLLTDANRRGRKDALSMEDRGLFEEMLLPGVQEWLLTVSSMDRKDMSTISSDAISVLETPCTDATNESPVADMKDFDEYDLIGRNIHSLKLMTPQEIESLPSRSLGFDDAHLKNEPGNIEEFSYQNCQLSNDVDHKLLNILAMDASNDTLETASFPGSESLGCQIKKELDKPSALETYVLLNSSETKEALGNDKLPFVVSDHKETIKTNSNQITPDNTRKLEIEDSKPSTSVRTTKSMTRTQKPKLEKSVQTKGLNGKTVPKLLSKLQWVVKKDVASVPLDKEPPALEKSMTISLKPVQTQSPKGSSEIQNSCTESADKSGRIVTSPKVVGISNLAGIAKVNVSVNCKNNSTNVSIISSNKEHTVFKINTSDLIRAVSSIKEPFLAPLGLKNQQLMDTAIAAQKLLDIHSHINVKNSNDTTSKWPQNFEINQYIQEVKPPISRTRQEVPKTDNISQLITTNIGNAVIVTNKKEDSSQILQPCSSSFQDKLKNKITLKKIDYTDKSRQGENVSISLLPGAPPTMVSVPSILDALSGPTSSRVNLSQVLGISEVPSNGEEEESKDGQEDNSSCDEKTNSALVQLGVDPEKLLPEVDPDGNKVWSCPIPNCTKIFTKLSCLKVHILSHKGIRPYKCSYEKCDWSFYTSYKLKRHLETHLKRRDFVCTEPDCNRRFTTIYNLKTHELLHKRPKSWLCSLHSCSSAFHTRRMLENHMKQHKNLLPPYVCSFEGCSKGYFTPNTLASHMRSHHKEEDLKCQWPECGKKFDKPCRLKAHMRVHTGQRPYACTYAGCNWRFQCASKLSRHQRKHTNDRKYLCPICKKGFLRSEHLKGHLLTHTGVRNFECPISNCHAKFTAKSSLYVHLKKHKAPKSPNKFHCPIDMCSKKYDYKLGLRHHLRKDHIPFLDSSQMDYITLVGEKEPLVPLTLQVTPASDITPPTVEPHSTLERPLIHLSSSDNLVTSPPHESALGLSVSDVFLTASETELGFPEDVKTSSRFLPGGTSARTDVLGNIFLSQRAKQRRQQQHNGAARKVQTDFAKVSFCNDLLLTNSVDPMHLSTNFQTAVIQDDASGSSLYEDSLINQDILPDHQSTINLRDLE